jgi:hypothetical protein
MSAKLLAFLKAFETWRRDEKPMGATMIDMIEAYEQAFPPEQWTDDGPDFEKLLNPYPIATIEGTIKPAQGAVIQNMPKMDDATRSLWLAAYDAHGWMMDNGCECDCEDIPTPCVLCQLGYSLGALKPLYDAGCTPEPVAMPPKTSLHCGCDMHGALATCPVHETEASPFNVHPGGRKI